MAPRRAETKTKWECFCRQGIQDAVVRLISREGTSALTMERVAAEAGVAKGTLYVYYKDKTQLLESVKEASMQPMREELFAILEGGLPPDEKLKLFIHRHLGYLDANRDFYRILLWDREIAEAHLKRHQTERYRSYMDRISRVLEEGMRQGIFRRLDPVKMAAMLMEADMAVISQRLWSEKPGPVEEDAELLFDILLHGIVVHSTVEPARHPRKQRNDTPSTPRVPAVRTARQPVAPRRSPRKDPTP